MPRVQQGQDVGVLQLGEKTNFPDEAELSGLRPRVGFQDLECDAPIMPEIVGQVDRGKCSLTDLTLNLVTAGDSGSKRTDRISHGESWGAP